MSTSTQWLPTLCNIGPPMLRRKQIFLNEWKKCTLVSSLPIHSYGARLIKLSKLKSRKPSWRTTTKLNTSNIILLHASKEEWTSSNLNQNYSVTRNANGHELLRKLWLTLNWIRTGHDKYGNLMHRLNILSTPNCDCGHLNQTTSHMISQCPNRKYNDSLEDLSIYHQSMQSG